jgi:hypothetical protein
MWSLFQEMQVMVPEKTEFLNIGKLKTSHKKGKGKTRFKLEEFNEIALNFTLL